MKPNPLMRSTPGCAVLLFIASLACAAQGPGANSWSRIGPGGGGTTIGPTISPHDARVVVEHCDMTGGYVTRDNGESWRMFNLRGGIGVLAFDPTDPQVIYAGNAALWRSGDSGQSWQMVFPSPATMPSSINSAITPTIVSPPATPPIPVATSPQSPLFLEVARQATSIFILHSSRGAGLRSSFPR